MVVNLQREREREERSINLKGSLKQGGADSKHLTGLNTHTRHSPTFFLQVRELLEKGGRKRESKSREGEAVVDGRNRKR